MSLERTMNSPYMHWVKTESQSEFNLVSSDLLHYPLANFNMSIRDLEINGPGGYGYAPLRQAIADKCGVNPECVVSSLGTSMANHVAMAALLNPGDEVLLEHPTYELLLSTLNYLGATVKSLPRRFENRFAIDPDDLRRLITPRTKLIVLTNLHNPSSAFIDETTLKEIGRIAADAGARVLVDEVYLDAVFALRPRSAFHLGDVFVTTNSLTKVFGLSGLRCGWILAEPRLAEKMWRLSDLFHSTQAHVAELISVTAFQQLGTLIARSRLLLEANTLILNELFASCGRLESFPHLHGLVAFPKFATSDMNRFYAHLRSGYKMTVVPGTFFGLQDHFRIGIGKDSEFVRNALTQLKGAIESYPGI